MSEQLEIGFDPEVRAELEKKEARYWTVADCQKWCIANGSYENLFDQTLFGSAKYMDMEIRRIFDLGYLKWYNQAFRGKSKPLSTALTYWIGILERQQNLKV